VVEAEFVVLEQDERMPRGAGLVESLCGRDGDPKKEILDHFRERMGQG
jgi:hypothetical protein